jgi:ATP-dependent protease ClpP protease subunit
MTGLTHVNENVSKYKEIHYAAESLHEYGLNFERREIFLFGREEYGASGAANGGEPPGEPGVEYMMANQFIKNIRMLTSMSDDPILIHMKTCGGYWEEGMAIYWAIKSCPNYVTILNYIHARSMSSLIFLAADWRVMMPSSVFMMHKGTSVLAGTGTQVDTDYRQGKIAEQQMLDIYVDAMIESPVFVNKTRRQVQSWIERQMKAHEDVYFSAEDTIQYGLADMIFGAGGTYDWSKLRYGWTR